ncbi:MAG: TIGR03067 domain-containing protein [Flavipsychrobacter sp.]
MKANQLNGTWVPVKQEIGGMPLPAAALNQKMIIDDGNYTVIAESTDKGTIEYKDGDKMDIYGKDGVNAGKHFTAIYKYDGHQLTICYNLAGSGYPEAYETKDKPGFFLSVFEREGNK